MALPEDESTVHMDAWGIKRLFSHLLRRWLSGASKPRDAYPVCVMNVFPYVNFF